MNIEITDYEAQLILTSLVTAIGQASKNSSQLIQNGAPDAVEDYLKFRDDSLELYNKIHAQVYSPCPICGTQHTTKGV